MEMHQFCSGQHSHNQESVITQAGMGKLLTISDVLKVVLGNGRVKSHVLQENHFYHISANSSWDQVNGM